MQVMEIIHAYDGDVMKFAGDSVIVAFYPTAAEREEGDAGLQAATVRCARCSASLIANCGTLLLKQREACGLHIERNRGVQKCKDMQEAHQTIAPPTPQS